METRIQLISPSLVTLLLFFRLLFFLYPFPSIPFFFAIFFFLFHFVNHAIQIHRFCLLLFSSFLLFPSSFFWMNIESIYQSFNLLLVIQTWRDQRGREKSRSLQRWFKRNVNERERGREGEENVNRVNLN